MNHPIPHSMPSSATDGGQSTERGPDGLFQVLISLDGRLRRIPVADFVGAERLHALALRRAAIDQAFMAAAVLLRRQGRRLRRRMVVALGRGLRATATHRATVNVAV
jgi:hypothetical protein